MKLSVVGVRNGKRVIWWQGGVAVGIISAALGVLGFFAFRLLMPAPLLPGVILALTIPAGSVLAAQLIHAHKTPIDKLPQLKSSISRSTQL